MKTHEVTKLLRARFCAPEWAIFFEVAEGTGSAGGRYADAVAMNLWPSRGCAVHGFEVKVSRGDWLRELKQPAKSEPIQKHCDFWWVVAPKGVVFDGELPPTWGMFEVDGRGLRCKVQAPKLPAQPMTRAFFASLARNSGRIGADERQQLIDDALVVERLRMKESLESGIREGTRELADLKASLAKFEESSGISINRWTSASLGRAARLVNDLGITNTYGALRRAANDARAFAENVERSLGELESDGDAL